MDVFDLVAKIRLDDSEYESGIGKAKGSFSNLASGVKTGLATVAKVGAAAVSAGVAGVTALTKMGVEGYAQYEQLVGGVETLFKTSQDTVMRYAENAYKTAGMSANEYMETVTSFSASLIQSLDGDTAKAAEVGNMAITDMSDNANKMGTSIEMIQNAYNGFAKQNYTMLDNLKLGYGGTKEEMQRLIDDANKVKEANGEMADLSIDSFADVAEAIHIIQTEMGITGTTSREAATTIEGSLSMMKGAWQNLVVGMADENANMDVLINNFVESVATAATNLLPRIEQTLIGIGDLITALAPVIAEALPVLVEAVLPALLSAAVSLVTALVNGIITALPAVYDALLMGVQTILVEVFGVSEEKAGEFADGVNSFFVSIKDGFMALVESAQTEGTFLNGVWEFLKETAQAVGDALKLVWDGVSAAFVWCSEQINTEGTFLNGVWKSLQEAGEKLGNALSEVWDKIYAAVDWAAEQINTSGTWLNEIWTGLQNAAQLLGDFFVALWDAISSAFTWCVEQINTEGTFLNGVFTAIKDYVSVVFDNIKTAISGAIEFIQGVIATFTAILQGDWEGAWTAIQDTAQGVWDAICECWGRVSAWFDKYVVQPINENVIQPIVEFFTGLWNSIVEIWDGICFAVDVAVKFIAAIFDAAFQLITLPFRFIWENCKEYVFSAFEWIKEKIAVASEWISEKVAVVWGWIRDNIVTPVKSAYEKAVEIFNNVKSAISEKITAIKDKVTEIFNSIKEKMQKPIEQAKNTITNVVNSIKTAFSNGLNAAKTVVSNILGGIKDKFSSIFDGAKNIVKKAIDAIKGFFKFNVELPKIKLPHFGIKPAGWQIGDLLKGSIPSLDIQWYKKAYDNAMILSKPTIFGYSNGSFLGGGDGNGNEIVTGESHLMGMIGQVVESRTANANAKVVALLGAILETMTDGNEEMVRALMSDRTFAVGEREFARLVRTYA